MASFYNNYYRYYRPYLAPSHKSYSVPDKSFFPDDVSISSDKEDRAEDKVRASANFYATTSKKQEKSSKSYSFGPIQFKNPLFTDMEEPIFEIFGIELYLDDIIILGLLFFLYQEGVQDEMLFIALILLLLS